MDILLKTKLTFRCEDQRKNVLLPFEVPRDYDRLVFVLRYGPKFVTDPQVVLPRIEECIKTYLPAGTVLTETDMADYLCLKNLITISVDYEDEYLGCAHRHAYEHQLEISEHGSEWGFAARRIEKGMWRAVLHIQGIVAGEVDYHLAVCAMEKGEGNDLLPSV